MGTNVLGEGAPVRAAALVETPTAATVCCWDDEPATVEVEGVDIVAGVELVDLVAAEVAGVVDLDLDLGTGGVDLDLATGGVDLGLATGGVDLGLATEGVDLGLPTGALDVEVDLGGGGVDESLSN